MLSQHFCHNTPFWNQVKKRALEKREKKKERMRALESSKKKIKKKIERDHLRKKERMRAMLNEEEDKKEGG